MGLTMEPCYRFACRMLTISARSEQVILLALAFGHPSATNMAADSAGKRAESVADLYASAVITVESCLSRPSGLVEELWEGSAVHLVQKLILVHAMPRDGGLWGNRKLAGATGTPTR